MDWIWLGGVGLGSYFLLFQHQAGVDWIRLRWVGFLLECWLVVEMGSWHIANLASCTVLADGQALAIGRCWQLACPANSLILAPQQTTVHGS